MKKLFFCLGLLLFVFNLMGCGPKLSRENYVALMTDLGCKMTLENTPAAEEVYKKFGATPQDVQEFRQKTKSEIMMQVATQIATNVAACHGSH